MSIVDWINESVPAGGQLEARAAARRRLQHRIRRRVDEQSALNLIYLLGYSGPGQLRIFGQSNEKYHVAAATT